MEEKAMSGEISVGKREGFSVVYILITAKMFCSYLPGAVAAEGGSCWYTAALSCGAAFLGFWFINSCGFPLFELFEKSLGKTAGKAMQVLFSAYFYLYAAAALNEFIKIIKIYNFPTASPVIFAAASLAAAVIVGANGFTAVSRLSEFYIKLVIITYLLIFALGTGQYSYMRLFPVFGHGAVSIASGFLSGISVFSDALILLCLKSEAGSKNCFRAGRSALIFSGITVTAATLFYNCVFDYTVSGEKASGMLETVKNVYRGHLVQRVESVFFLMMTVVFAVSVCILFSFAVHMFGKAFEIQDRRPCLVPSAALILGICVIMPFASALSPILKWGGAAAFGISAAAAAVYKLKGRARAAACMAVILPLVLLCGCSDMREVSDEAYAILLGVDKAKNGVKLTAAMPTYESEEESQNAVYTVVAENIPEGLNKLNFMLTRKVSLMHLKAVVFSAEISREGLSQYAPSIQRHIDVQNAMGVMVSEGSAEEQIRFMCDSGSGNISKEAELLLLSKKYNSFYPVVMFDTFCDNMTSPYISPVCALGTAEGEMISGIALFDGDRMTASLDPSDAAYYMLARGKLRGVQLTFSDGTYAEITENKSKISVKGNKVSVKITAEGISGGGTKDINSEREFAEAEMCERTRAVLRLAERSGCDILGAKGEAAKNYLTVSEWQKFTPDEDAADVEVKLTLTRGVNG